MDQGEKVLTMFDRKSKIQTLSKDFDLDYLLQESGHEFDAVVKILVEEFDVSDEYLIELLVNNEIIDPDQFIDVSNEEEEIESWEQ
jgi:hypothetical protein